MGDSEANVATTALVVAVLALFIALGQFTQQIFGTAEGYRRCQDSVIGPWARLTRLSWRWQGFRCETIFTTPAIRYLTRLETQEGDYFLEDIKEYPKPRGLHWLRNKLGFWPWSRDSGDAKEIIWDTIKCKKEPDNDGRDLGGDERRPLNDLTEIYNYHADWVTWRLLLHALVEEENRDNTLSNFHADAEPQPVDMKLSLSVRAALKPPSATAALMTPPATTPLAVSTVTVTSSAVRLVERSWDLIPPEVVRPFAETTIGDLISIVGRLRMAWQTFRPEERRLNAQGRGHSISATEVRGLGTLCEYRFDPSQRQDSEVHGWDTSIGGCRETDMFRCGIIPSSFPGIKNISLVVQGPDDCSVIDNFSIDRFLDIFDFKDQVRESIRSTAIFTPSEDERTPRLFNDKLGVVLCEAIGIIAPFMPLRGTLGAHLPWPLPDRRVFVGGLFWETRSAFLHHLQNHPNVHSESEPILHRILSGMNYVEQNFPNHFYCRWYRAGCVEKNRPKHKARLIEFCRTEHAWTSSVLFKRSSPASVSGNALDDEDVRPCKRILDWHLSMAARELSEVFKSKKAPGPIEDRYKWLKGNKSRGPHTTVWALEMGLRYVKAWKSAIDNGEKLFVDHGDLWWVMIYRSFCWYLCVKIDRSQPPLPSVYWGSKMPVYIG